MNLKNITLALALVMSSISAQADRHFPGFAKFAKSIEAYKAACDSEACAAPYSTKLLLSEEKNHSAIEPALLSQLQKAAEGQVVEWQDGVLEDDFITDGRTILTKVIGIYENQALVGYKITYIQKSWDISSCNFDLSTPEKLDDCVEGFIRESSFVGKELQNVMRNHDEIAEFHIVEKKK